MPLTMGTRLGPYEIVSKLGAGGMGEVYRATDTNLKRQVAIKVVPAALADDADRLVRFQREAEILAALNHPNIAHIHGLEKSDGTVALVMELVEGPTLADRIATDAIPVTEALTIARQIAEALEAAHEQGIVHRDLKPANIKVRDDGTVKVLDFGLAKALGPETSSLNATISPTISIHATQAGVILGTAAYMSPEQARGRMVTKRTDIWAFGCVLFEMLSGARAFDGEDVAETIGAVIHKDPPWTKLPAGTPSNVRTVLERCLQKDPKQRIRDMGDVLLALSGAFESGVPSSTAVPASRNPSQGRTVAIALAAACLSAVIAGIAAWSFKPVRSLPVTRSRFELPDGLQFLNGSRQWLDVSPDGMHVVYTAGGGLFVRSLSDLDARTLIPVTSSPLITLSSPTFSPDGNSVAYFDGRTLKKVGITGGSPVALGEYDLPWGVSWGEGGILVGQGPKGIVRIPDNGGAPEQIVRVESNELAAHPRMLPGASAVLFSLAPNASVDMWDKAHIVAQRVDTGQRTTVVNVGSNPRYLSNHHLVYAVGGTIFAVPFDPRRVEVTGAAVQVEQNVRRSQSAVQLIQPAGISQYAVSDGGTFVFVPGSASAVLDLRRIVSMNRAGGITPLPLAPKPYNSIRVSPDGKRLAFDTDDGADAAIWIYDLSGATQPRRLTFQGRNRYPAWSADNQRVLFQSDRAGDLGIYWQGVDAGAAERLTTAEPGVAHVPESWSPTEDRFSFSVLRGTSVSLWTFSVHDHQATRFGTVESVGPFNAEFSPDGHWLAYTRRDGNSANIFVEPFPYTGDRNQISTSNGHHPVWLPGEKALSYRVGNSDQVLVQINTASGFSFGNPTPAIAGGLPTVLGSRSFDVTHDGRAFLVLAPASDNGSGITPIQEIRIIQNWTEVLKGLEAAK